MLSRLIVSCIELSSVPAFASASETNPTINDSDVKIPTGDHILFSTHLSTRVWAETMRISNGREICRIKNTERKGSMFLSLSGPIALTG